jgi:uncharacterized protein YdaU (DUF1376 family)
MHYFQLNIGDYRRDTSHLTLLEHGIYQQLLSTYYLSEKPLTANLANLMRTHSARTTDEQQSLKNVLSDFFKLTDDGYAHARCDDEIIKYHDKSDKAKASATARWNKKDANALRTQSDGNANHITNNHEPMKYIPPLADNLLSEWKGVRKAKKAGAITEMVWKAIIREAGKANLTTDEAITLCIERSWASFRADWINENKKRENYNDKRANTIGNLTGNRNARKVI